MGVEKQEYLQYKGKPLVRCGNVIYYGSMNDKFIIKMEVAHTKKVSDMDVADKVVIQLLDTDPNVRARKKIVKSTERDGLFSAVDIAEAWLDRALAKQ